MDKPKEWYFNPICKYRCEVNEDGIGLSGNEVHVIEYSAYEKLKEALERIVRANRLPHHTEASHIASEALGSPIKTESEKK